MFLNTLRLLMVALTVQTALGDELGRTPLCEKCRCVNQTLTDPDILCNATANVEDLLYDVSNWMYESKDANETNTLYYNVKSVNLQHNNLIELTKEFVGSNLTKLDLSHNSLQRLSDGIFKNLGCLDVLVLSYNQLSTLGQNVFKGPFVDGEDYPLKIKTLKLDNNQFHTLNQDLFEHIEYHLETLTLSHNPFHMIDMQTHVAITSIVNLKTLDLSHTQIKELPDAFFHTPKLLKWANLSGNKFRSVPRSIGDVHALETLMFNDNPLTNLTKENGFPVVPTLKTLHMSHMNDLESIGKGAMSGLINLKELYVTNNRLLKKIDAAALTRTDVENEVWPPIVKLLLNDNRLTHLEKHLLPYWEHLVQLDLSNNPWTCECENAWLLQLMPIYTSINKNETAELECAAPIEMEGKRLNDLHKSGYHLRCLDLYDNRPEKDGDLLIGTLVGVLIGIPLILFLLYAYQKKFFGLIDHSPASYSRRFYSRTSSGEL